MISCTNCQKPVVPLWSHCGPIVVPWSIPGTLALLRLPQHIEGLLQPLQGLLARHCGRRCNRSLCLNLNGLEAAGTSWQVRPSPLHEDSMHLEPHLKMLNIS